MAKTHKTSEAFEKSKLPNRNSPTRTELRNEEASERENEMSETRGRVNSFLAETDGRNLVQREGEPKPATEVAPTGGKPDEVKPADKPPIAQITPEPSGNFESMEQFDERVEGIQAPKGQEQNVRGIKQAWRKEHELVLNLDKEKQSLQSKLKELEGKIPSEQDMAKWKGYEKIVETSMVEQLPKWKEYDEAATKFEGEVADMLKGCGVPEQTIEAINKRGGIAEFASSNKPAGPKFKNEDGSPMTEAEWFEQNVVNAHKLNQPDRIKLFSLIDKAKEKRSEKDRDMATAREQGGEALKKESETWRTHVITSMKGKLEEVMKKELPRFDYPLEKPKILATDTPEEKKEKEGMIERWDKADKFISEAASAMATTALKPEYAAEFAFKAAFYDEVMSSRENDRKAMKDLQLKVDELQAFKDSVKNARRLPKTPTEPKKEELQKPQFEQSTEERLAAAHFK